MLGRADHEAREANDALQGKLSHIAHTRLVLRDRPAYVEESVPRSRSRSLSVRGLLAPLALGLGLAATPALAHGPDPSALAALRTDATGLRAVRLNSGLALRGADGFRFLCPALWGSDTSAPALGRDDGTIAIAAISGLYILRDDQLTLHPASRGARALGVAESAGQLFALLLRDERYELVRVSDAELELVWSDAGPWDSLGASRSFLQLVALRAETVSEALITNTGAELARQKTEVAPSILLAEARPANDVAYVLLTAIGGSEHSIGRFRDDRYETLVTATKALEGPVVSDGGVLLTRDGELASFTNEQLLRLTGDEPVSALSSAQGRAYATVRRGLRAIEGEHLGELAFDFAELREPDLERVPITRRDTCLNEWLHVEYDLITTGLQAPDAGTPSTGQDAAPIALPGDAGAPLGPDRQPTDAEGCQLDGRVGAAWWFLGLSLLLRGRRPASSGGSSSRPGDARPCRPRAATDRRPSRSRRRR